MRDFYIEVNSQFGLLKDTYRNHSEHARDDHYDMPKALHILNHVRDFMPVSYTHLDVYKRQGKVRPPTIARCRFRSCAIQLP